MTQQPEAPDFAAQVDRAYWRLRALGPTELPADRRKPIPCPKCGYLSLAEEFRPVRQAGDPDRAWIVCGRIECAAAFTAAELDQYARAAGNALQAGAA
jgi:hypothetical protein